ncbi:hypothetical protein N656DRAFT_166309 [Canariomyces notabilis]|uniref:Uncharacterized protein n=1 Tax=Canariomyces notabilis TaxID=2074819 RepID=A0AAN6QIT9_9PEZI|nr:hypothetical protein N656DRAFT_166309 [Canariomyces arenarius]
MFRIAHHEVSVCFHSKLMMDAVGDSYTTPMFCLHRDNSACRSQPCGVQVLPSFTGLICRGPHAPHHTPLGATPTRRSSRRVPGDGGLQCAPTQPPRRDATARAEEGARLYSTRYSPCISISGGPACSGTIYMYIQGAQCVSPEPYIQLIQLVRVALSWTLNCLLYC